MKHYCSSGKKRHTSLSRAKIGAKALARELNAEGQIASNLYAYKCSECHGWHLTRQAGWPGIIPALTAAPEELQRWAMTGEVGS